MRVELEKSLEEVGFTKSAPGDIQSNLIELCNAAVCKKLIALTPAEVRLLVSQKIGLSHTIPLALNILEQDVLIQAEFYRGDLVLAILNTDMALLNKTPDWASQLYDIKIELELLHETLSEQIVPLLANIPPIKT